VAHVHGEPAARRLDLQAAVRAVAGRREPELARADRGDDQAADRPPRAIAQGRRYYERFVEQYGEDSDWVRATSRRVRRRPVRRRGVQEFVPPDFHIVDDTLLIPGYPILIGQDFGRNPWSLICQMDHLGRLVVHQEVPAPTSAWRSTSSRPAPLLWSTSIWASASAIVGDPSGVAKGNVSEESCFDALSASGCRASRRRPTTSSRGCAPWSAARTPGQRRAGADDLARRLPASVPRDERRLSLHEAEDRRAAHRAGQDRQGRASRMWPTICSIWLSLFMAASCRRSPDVCDRAPKNVLQFPQRDGLRSSPCSGPGRLFATGLPSLDTRAFSRASLRVRRSAIQRCTVALS
jgi:hypothetical protein